MGGCSLQTEQRTALRPLKIHREKPTPLFSKDVFPLSHPLFQMIVFQPYEMISWLSITVENQEWKETGRVLQE